MGNTVLITDVGSTSTKAILLARASAGWRLVGRGEAPTTVEKPHENVMVGVVGAVKALEAATGHRLLLGAAPFRVAADLYLSTSSAGGGLQVLVVGLAKGVTAESAEKAALGAGAIISGVVAADDGRPVFHRVELIRELRPDIILLAGGLDGGNDRFVLEMCDFINAANPRPRLGGDFRLPLVYAGNREAREAVADTLGDQVELHVVENLRPALNKENLLPTREAIHELFMNHVMAKAPGYSELAAAVAAPVLPTPAAAGYIMLTLAGETKKNILGVDIGGATTDIFSVIEGAFNRTVSANIGMSYSALNVLTTAGVQKVARWLTDGSTDSSTDGTSPAWNESAIRDMVAGKMVRPASLPASQAALNLEQALAREAIRIALEQHKEIVRTLPEERAHRLPGLDQEVDLLAQRHRRTKVEMDRTDLIVGSGGVLSHAPSRLQATAMLIDAFQPEGVTELAVDSIFMMPHLGVLATVDPQAALEVLWRDCLVPLGTCVSPVGAYDGKTGQVSIEVHRSAGAGSIEHVAPAGKLTVVPLGGGPAGTAATAVAAYEVTLSPSPAINLGRGAGAPVKVTFKGGGGTGAALTIDLRGRPLAAYSDGDLAAASKASPYAAAAGAAGAGAGAALWTDGGNGNGTGKAAESPLFGPVLKVRRLPYTGRVQVTEGQRVQPDTSVARLEYLPGRLTRVDISRGISVPPAEASRYLIKGLGERVAAGEVVATAAEFGQGRVVTSPVDGIVGLVSKRLGYLYLREPIPIGGREPVVIDVPAALGIKPALFRRALRLDPRRAASGRLLLEKGAVIAAWEDRPGHFNNVISPIYGYLTGVDLEAGTVTIGPYYTSTEILAYVPGAVAATVANESVTIETPPTTHFVPGVFGVGGERYGRISVVSSLAAECSPSHIPADCSGLVLVAPGWVTKDTLAAAASAGAVGFVAGGCHEMDLVGYLGTELGAGVTGNEDLAMSVVLTGGFGTAPMNQETWATLQKLDGRQVSLNGATHLRAGVVRPEVIITGPSPFV